MNQSFPQQLIETAQGDSLLSVLSYPHPLTSGGYIVIWQDDTPQWINCIALVQSYKPPEQTAYCMRRSELGFFAQPNLFAPPLQTSERPHLPYYLQHKGACLFGEDLRQEIKPADPNLLLQAHIEGCMDYLRRYGVLTLLMEEKPEKLIGLLHKEIKTLMATALLLYEVWDIHLSTVPEQFQPHFPTAYQTWQALQKTDDILRVVWLFEQFLRQLRGHLS